MTTSSSALDFPAAAARRRPDALLFMTGIVLVISTAAKILIGGSNALWLDETFTGAIAAEPTLAGVLHQSLQDVNAPLFYVLEHFWVKLAGLSNAALRFPALAFSLLAPLLCLTPLSGADRNTRLIWCALTALWIPGVIYAQEARCYSLLLCFAIAGVVAFARLLEKPDAKRAALWAGISALAILTHYHAIILAAAQGVIYLAIKRETALRTWPAAFLFAPAFAWLALHAPRIAQYADPAIAWYDYLTPAQLFGVASFIAGSSAFAIGATLIAIAAGYQLTRETARNARLFAHPLAISSLAAVSGALIVIGLGFIRPSLSVRYLIPFVPGVLLGASLLLQSYKRKSKAAPEALIIVAAIALMSWSYKSVGFRKLYSFEQASYALMATNTNNLVFFWDHPANPIMDNSQLKILSRFFYSRAGVEATTTPVKFASGEDPNPRLIELASEPGTGVLWIFDRNVRGTAAREFPPQIDALSVGWNCRDFGAGPIGIVACARAPL